jgi:hypothetical protein
MIDLLHNIGKGVGLFASGVALLFGGASTLHTQPTIQPTAVALAVAPTQQMTAAVGTSTTPQTSTSKTSVGKVVTASASPALPSASVTAPISATGVSRSYVDDQIQALRNSISLDVFKNSSYLYPANAGISQAAVNAAISQRIDQLSNVTITNTTVHGVSGLTAADIPTGIVASNYLPLGGGAVTGDLSVSGTASTSNLVVSNAFTFGSFGGVLKSVAGVVSATLVNLASDVTGILPIANGGTGTSTAPTYGKVLLGNASGGYDMVATSTLGITAGGSGSVGAGAAGQFAYFAGNGTTLTATSSVFLSTAGNMGLGTTSPFARLSIAGAAGGTNNLFAISTSTTGFATSTALRISQNGNLHLMNGAGIDIGSGVIPPPNGLIVAGTASTSNLVASNAFTFGTVTGFLKATAGVVATSLINLASDVTGILPIANGGTGTSTTPTYGQILVGNANGGYDLTATSSLGIVGSGSAQWTTNGSNISYTVGNVGVGTSSPWANLSVAGTSLGTSPAFTVSTSTASATSTALIVDSSGRLGIGTTSPFANLSVTGTGYFSGNLQVGSIASVIPTALATPPQVVAIAVGTTGTSRKYKVVAYGAGNTAGSPVMTNPVSSASTLDASNYVSITPPAGAGIVEYQIYRTQSGGTSPSLTVGFVGRVAPGVEFRDTGINATADIGSNQPPTVDGGSAGIRTSGPVVGTHDQTGNFGAFQFGPQPAAVTIGDTQGGTSAMGAFTGNGTSGIYFNALNNGAMRLIGRSTNSTDILRPVSTPGGTLNFSSEQYIKGSQEAWRVNSNYELGGGSVSGTALTDNYGKHQFGIALGGDLSSTQGGFMLTGAAWANDALRNKGAVVLTNLVDFVQYQTGLVHTTSTQDPANSEYVFGGWASGGTTYNFGPVATGAGLLRPMNFTGSAVGVGTSSPWAKFSVAGASLGTIPLFVIATSTASATSTAFFVDSNGKVGIGTTSPSTQLQVSGVVTPNADNVFSLGNATYRWSAVFSANGTIQTSDARLKNNINDINYGLADLLKLHPVSFKWIAQPGQGTQLGFIAQEVQPLFPEVVNVGDDANHTLGITYTGFIPVIVKSIQELAGKISTTAHLVIDTLTAQNVQTHQLCIDSTCITEAQLKSILNNQGAAAASNTNASTTPDTTPPVITITGDNPARLHIGDTYSDLGATVTDNVDHNLGVHAFVGSTALEQASIDTSTTTTYLINYVATDSAGNTATSTRTVIVGN